MLALLESKDSTKKSNHRISYCRAEMARLKACEWQTYTYRHFNEASVELFKEWVALHNWQEVLQEEGSNNKANAYQATISGALEKFFPLKTTRRKTTDLPWMNK